MSLASKSKFILIIPLVLLALSSDSWAGKIPKADIDVLIRQSSEFGQSLVSRISINIERELRDRGFARDYRPFFEREMVSRDDSNLISITVYKSLWKTDKGFSIPFILNSLRRVYEIEVFLEFTTSDGKRVAERLTVSQDMGAETQVMTNDPYDPDLFPDQSSRLAVEDSVIRQLAREITNRLGAKLS